MKKWPRRALLVIAHPDDEAMFFAPTLQQLEANGVDTAVLCLCTGETLLLIHKHAACTSVRYPVCSEAPLVPPHHDHHGSSFSMIVCPCRSTGMHCLSAAEHRILPSLDPCT